MIVNYDRKTFIVQATGLLGIVWNWYVLYGLVSIVKVLSGIAQNYRVSQSIARNCPSLNKKETLFFFFINFFI